MTVDSYDRVKNGSSSLNSNVKGHLKCVRVSQTPAVQMNVSICPVEWFHYLLFTMEYYE